MAGESAAARRPRLTRATAWVFALALLLRVAWVLLAWSRHGEALEFDDERLHWALARNLVTRGSMVTDDGLFAARLPAYPLFLACFAWAGDRGVLAARLAQAVLGAAAAAIVQRLARREVGAAGGVVAGLLAACDPFTVFASNLLLTEAPYIFLSLALLAATLRLAGARSAAALAAASVCGTACVMTRPASLLWVAMLWFWAVVRACTARQRWRRLALFAAVFASAMAPWGLRNYAVIGDYAWLSTNGGITLYDGQGPRADGSSDQSFLADMPEIAALPEAQRDRALSRLALAQMRSDPLRCLRLAWAKLVRMWNILPNHPEFRAGAIGWLSAAWTTLLVAFALAGSGRATARDRLRTVSWLTIGYFTLLHCVYVGSVRYRVPLHPFLALLAAGIAARPPANQPADAVSVRA